MRRLIRQFFKRLSERPAVIPAITGIAGMYLSYICRSDLPAAVLACALLFSCITVCIRIRRFDRTVLILTYSAFLAAAVYVFSRGCLYKELLPGSTPEDASFGGRAEISIDGYVRSVRIRADDTCEAVIYDSSYGRLLYSCDPSSAPDVAARAGGTVTLAVSGVPTNPGEFDYSSYLRRQGIRGSIDGDVAFGDPNGPISEIAHLSLWLSRAVRNFILDMFGDERDIAAAVFMGDTSLLDDASVRAFRLAGCSHLLAVSGTHFTGFLMVLPQFLKRLRLPKAASLTVYALFCLFLGLITGWSPSVTRAAVMSFCTYAVRDNISAMALACNLLLFADPFSVLSSGFIMSFSAALSMIIIAPKIESHLKMKTLSYTLAAMAGMMPLWTDIGVYISFPTLVIQMISSFLAQLACIFFPFSVLLSVIFGRWASFICLVPVKLMTFLVRTYSTVAMYSVSSRNIGTLLILALYILILVRCFPVPSVSRVLVRPAALFLAVCLGISVAGLFMRPEATAVFIDVGQGDSCLIMSSGCSVLIDGGTYEAGEFEVSSVLDYYSIPRVDIAFVSHWDLDHAGGIVYLYEQGRIGRVFAPDPPDKSGLDLMYEMLGTGEVEFTPLCLGQTVRLDDMSFTCISPAPSSMTIGSNDDSLVLHALVNGTSFLFTGDISSEVESQLLGDCLVPDVDVLKVAHHGSRFSSSAEFLSEVSPELAVISAGRHNSYGHPAPETLSRLESDTVHCTAWEGAVFAYIYDDRTEVSGMLDSG